MNWGILILFIAIVLFGVLAFRGISALILAPLVTCFVLIFSPIFAGQDIAIPDLQDTHYDIIGVTIEKLVNCTKVYQRIVELDPNGETYIIRYAAGEIKDLLKCAIEEHRVDESKATKKIKEQLDKLKIDNSI